MEKINYNELYTDTDIHTGEDIFYIDKDLKEPFNGIVVDYFKGILSWEFDVKSGFRTGKEKKYYESGELMEENDVNHNTVDGIAKEFYKNGKLKSISIVMHNVTIDAIFYDETEKFIRKFSINEKDRSYFLVVKKIDEYRSKYKLCHDVSRTDMK